MFGFVTRRFSVALAVALMGSAAWAQTFSFTCSTDKPGHRVCARREDGLQHPTAC